MDESMSWAEWQKMIEEEKAKNPEPEEVPTPKKRVVKRPAIKKPELTPEQLEKKRLREEAEKKRRAEMKASILAKRKQLKEHVQSHNDIDIAGDANKDINKEESLNINESKQEETQGFDKPQSDHPQVSVNENIEDINQEKKESSPFLPSEISEDKNQYSNDENKESSVVNNQNYLDSYNPEITIIEKNEPQDETKQIEIEKQPEETVSPVETKSTEDTKMTEETIQNLDSKTTENIIETFKTIPEEAFSSQPFMNQTEETETQVKKSEEIFSPVNETVTEKDVSFDFKPTDKLNEPFGVPTNVTIENQFLNPTNNIKDIPSEPFNPPKSNNIEEIQSQLTESIESLKVSDIPEKIETIQQPEIVNPTIVPEKNEEPVINENKPTPQPQTIPQTNLIPEKNEEQPIIKENIPTSQPQTIRIVEKNEEQPTINENKPTPQLQTNYIAHHQKNVNPPYNYQQTSSPVSTYNVQHQPSNNVVQQIQNETNYSTSHSVVPQPMYPSIMETPQSSNKVHVPSSPPPSSHTPSHVNHYNESYNPPLSPHIHGNVMPREHIHSPNYDSRYYPQPTPPTQQHSYQNINTPQRNIVPPYVESRRHTPSSYMEPSYSSEPGYIQDYNQSYDQPYGYYYSSSPKGYTSRISMMENRSQSLFGTPSRYFNPNWKEKSFQDQSSFSLVPSWLTSTNLSENKDLEKIRKDMEKQFKNMLLNYESSIMKHYETNLESRQSDVMKELEILKRKNEEMSIELAKLTQKNEILVAQNREATKELNVIKAKGQLQESKILNLQEQLNLKVQENLKLAQLCDELISNLESSQKMNQR